MTKTRPISTDLADFANFEVFLVFLLYSQVDFYDIITLPLFKVLK